MVNYISQCQGLLVCFCFSVGLGVLLFFASAFLAPKIPTLEKVSAYECGFEPFEDARSKFDVRFYLVALLFIIFDLEVAFLFPLAETTLSFTGFFIVFLFLLILTLGFIYEWSQNALQWT